MVVFVGDIYILSSNGDFTISPVVQTNHLIYMEVKFIALTCSLLKFTKVYRELIMMHYELTL